MSRIRAVPAQVFWIGHLPLLVTLLTGSPAIWFYALTVAPFRNLRSTSRILANMALVTPFDAIELSDSEVDDMTMSLPPSTRSSAMLSTPEPMNIDSEVDEDDDLEILNREEWQELNNRRARTQQS